MFIDFTASTSIAGICVACLKLATLPRRIVDRLYRLKLHVSFSINSLSSIPSVHCIHIMDNSSFFSHRYGRDISKYNTTGHRDNAIFTPDVDNVRCCIN